MLCTPFHSFVQCWEVFVLLYLGARENIFNITIHCKYVENYILSRHVTIFLFDQKMLLYINIFEFLHSPAFIFVHVYLKIIGMLIKIKLVWKWNANFFYRGLWYQRRIQNLVKHLRCSILRKWLTAKSR